MTREADPARVLVLFWSEDPANLRAAIRQHLRVFEYAEGDVDVLYHNARHGAPSWLARSAPDAVVLHTTFLCMRWSHLFSGWKWGLRWLQELNALKIAMPQDEYDHSEILDEWLYELGVDVVFSNFGPDKHELLYPLMHRRARFLTAFTGYIDDATAERYRARIVPPSGRPHDVVYRATRLPFWFGSHGQLKFRIGEEAERRARGLGLLPNISTRLEDTIVGDAWIDFLMSGRAVVGCESGSSVLDRRGEIQAAIRTFLQREPNVSFEDVSARLPAGWDAYDFFAVSPRHFEAVITKTAQILVEGRYDGVLVAGRHYIPVKRDLSDLDEALAQAADPGFVENLVERAYEDIHLSGKYSYRRLAETLERVVSGAPRRVRRRASRAVWKAAPLGLRARRPGGREGSAVMAGIAFQPRRAAASAVVLGRLAADDRALRKLLARLLRARSAPANAIAGDLLRLAAAAAVRRKAIAPADWFELSLEFDHDDETLVLRSRPAPERGAGRPELDDAIDAVRQGLVRSIVWDHRAVGRAVRLPVVVSRQLSMSVRVGDRYEFPILSTAARIWPRETAAALSSLLAPDIPATGRLTRALTHPRLYRSLVVLSARELLSPRGLRWAAVAYARDSEARRDIRKHDLLRDVLRASLLLDAARSGHFSVDLAVEAGTLVVRSVPGTPSAEDRRPTLDAPVVRIVWDHSRVGHAIEAPGNGAAGPEISLGSDGVYEFSALSRLARAAGPSAGTAFADAVSRGRRERRSFESDPDA